jgi:hypothetical protein
MSGGTPRPEQPPVQADIPDEPNSGGTPRPKQPPTQPVPPEAVE